MTSLGSGVDSSIRAIGFSYAALGTGTGTVQSYVYLGLSTIVVESDGNGIALTYIKQTGESNGDAGDQYIGLDRFGRVVDQRYIIAGSPSSPTDRFQYGYDRDGNVLYKNNVVNSTFSELYHANSSASGDNNTAYDNVNELLAFRRGTLSSSSNNGSTLDTVSTLNSNSHSSQSYTLDAVGNQTSVTTDGTAQTNTVNSQNEETAAGSNSLAFDNNGNTTTDDQGHTLVYDAWNRLVTVKNGGTTIASYVYDANGNRVSQTESSTTTNFYCSTAGQDLEERQSSNVTNQYVWSIGYINELVLRDDNSTSGSYGKSSSGLGRRIYVQHDADFNVTALTDTSGNILQRFVYTPYGIMTVIGSTTAWNTTTDSYSWVYNFQGGRYDSTTGMIHFEARDYIPTLARWAQQDPAGYIDGANRYYAFLDSPLNIADPSGLCGDHNCHMQLKMLTYAEDALLEARNRWLDLYDAAQAVSPWASQDINLIYIYEQFQKLAGDFAVFNAEEQGTADVWTFMADPYTAMGITDYFVEAELGIPECTVIAGAAYFGGKVLAGDAADGRMKIAGYNSWLMQHQGSYLRAQRELNNIRDLWHKEDQAYNDFQKAKKGLCRKPTVTQERYCA